MKWLFNKKTFNIYASSKYSVEVKYYLLGLKILSVYK